MWLFTKPPTKLLKDKYGFEPTPQWLEHVQKSAVRFNTGGSGSFVSANGLVMTNHHVGSDVLEQLSTPEKNLLETGFVARTLAEEPKCPELELNVLWSIDDVTDRVKAAAKPDMPPADANTARRQMRSKIEKECEDSTKLDCQVVTLYEGGQYHLYRYRRYTDVRLVMAPEQGIAFFGGDTDNFEYPRFNLDMCFFRVYENDKPLQTEHFLKWSPDGGKENELAFVIGHPGNTERQNTVAALKFMRDYSMPLILSRMYRREVQLQTFSARNKEFERIASGDLMGVQNGRKAMVGRLEGLHDPNLMQAKIAEENKLRAAVDANPEFKAKWGNAWDQVAEAHGIYKEFYLREMAGLRSDLFGIARNLVRLADEKLKPSEERLREYSDASLDSLYLRLYSPAPIYDDLEINRLWSALSAMADVLGYDDPYVQKALGGMSPRQRAEQLVRETKLKDVAVRKALAEGGTAAIANSNDPMIKLAVALDPESRALRKKKEDEVESREREGYDKIAAARFAILGENTYPDATFTLRIAFGPIKSYRQNNKDVPAFTTFEGLYRRHEERLGEKAFDLPKSWLDKKASLNLQTPFNFVCTADIIGGNSGSPVINKKGEVIGLIFDGNIQGLVLDVAYTEEQARAVSVDSRAMIEAMRKIYQADALADELTGGKSS
jgi:hypothetical protein